MSPGSDRRSVERCIAAGLAFLFVAGCSDDMGPDVEAGSFDLIQTEIFDVDCVSCHASGTQFAEESGLALEAGVSYDELVGVDPVNTDAKDDGFVLVAPGQPDGSLLLHRVRADLPSSQPTYGQTMPIGRDLLTAGEVEFIRRWIEAGAPRTGSPVDPSLLDDDSPQQTVPFEAPPPPASGYQLHLGPFEIQPDSERELFAYRPLGNDEDIFVNRVEIAMRPGSHHFIVYQFREDTPTDQLPGTSEYRDLWRPDGSLDWSAFGGMTYRRRISGAQTADQASLFPEGVAIRMPEESFLDLNSHYLNYTDDVRLGEVYVNLHTVDPASVEHEAHSLFLNNTDLDIPPHETGQTTTIARNFEMKQAIRIVTLTSHMHEKGERFVIRRVHADGTTGEILYETDSWDHPDVEYFEPALEIEAGEWLRSEVTWHNPTNEAVSFGFTSKDEMAIAIGYYYLPD